MASDIFPCYNCAVMKIEKSYKQSNDCKRSRCPITNTLDVIGDKWTLLIIRDILFLDKRRYNELATSPEGIPTNILAQRLKHLEKEGIIEKRAYQQNPTRYEYTLTRKGKDLSPLLLQIMKWSAKHLPHAARPKGLSG